jgi:hypothetical protein
MGTVRTETLFKQGNTAMNVKKHRNGQVSVTFPNIGKARVAMISLSADYYVKAAAEKDLEQAMRYIDIAKEYNEAYEALVALDTRY